MKAADIPDELFLEGIAELRGPDERWIYRQQIDAWLSERMGVEVPSKVSLAKARKLIKRGKLDGCACGCRGDYVLPKKGISGWADLLMSYDMGYPSPFHLIIESLCRFTGEKGMSTTGILWISGGFPRASVEWRFLPL